MATPMVQKCRDVAQGYRKNQDADKVLEAVKEMAGGDEERENLLRCLVKWFAQLQSRIDKSVDRESVRKTRY